MNLSPTSERLRLDRREPFFMVRDADGELTRVHGPKNRPMPEPPVVKQPWRAGPLLLGALLAVAPPFGLWLLWAGAGTYSRDARVTLTVLGAFAGVLEAWVVIVTLRM